MGCDSCSSSKGGLPGGCKNNGACGVTGCNKLEVFDWLANMQLPAGTKEFNYVEVRFKNSRKDFYKNTNHLQLKIGDVVAVEASPGHDIGVVTITGELAEMQMKKRRVDIDSPEIKKVFRTARKEDIQRWQEARLQEDITMMKSRTIAIELGLKMKISDVEYQGDKTRATFFYTADERVDFRDLIKRLADLFKVRIEMRQIGARQEASRVGGIGSCGRELCCSTWLTDFRTVSTTAARYQQLSLNPQKLAGQCGKLKCCLNYELDGYMEALKIFPKTSIKLETEKGTAVHFKTDIFKKVMWYAYENQGAFIPIALTVESVLAVVESNKLGKKPLDLDGIVVEKEVKETDYMNVVGQDSLTRFDKKKKPFSKNQNQRRNNSSQRNTNVERKNNNQSSNDQSKK
jgi:cell fate regulator YaaT (PSP1 superfamily)